MEFCVRCETPTEVTETGKCARCDGITIVTSLLDELPSNWMPGMNFPADAFGYRHNYLSVSVAIFPENSDQNQHAMTYAAEVKWPNHLPHHKEWITPASKIVIEEDAKEWLTEVLSKVDEQYEPGDILSLCRSFGGPVETSTRRNPVVSTEKHSCDTCGAYLGHYRGDSPSSWYRSHVEYLSGDDHPKPEEPGQPAMQFEFDGECPHCEVSPISEQELIAHLEEHGYSHRDAYSIMDRVW